MSVIAVCVRHIDWKQSAPFLLVHLLALIGVFVVPFSWAWVGGALLSYYVRMFAITAGYHRYFSHRSFRTGRVFQFVLAYLGGTAAQKGALWWSAHHRHHHLESDTPNDLHSPVQSGFWWSHVGWIMSGRHNATQWHRIKDFAVYPELRWLNRYNFVPFLSYSFLMYGIGGWTGLVWGFFVSTVWLWHGVFTVNSLNHVLGSRRYATDDNSRNNWVLAILTMGEGWHNNHHHYQSAARQGFYWWELDVSYYLLKGFELLGIVWDVRDVPLKVRDGKPAPAAVLVGSNQAT